MKPFITVITYSCCLKARSESFIFKYPTPLFFIFSLFFPFHFPLIFSNITILPALIPWELFLSLSFKANSTILRFLFWEPNFVFTHIVEWWTAAKLNGLKQQQSLIFSWLCVVIKAWWQYLICASCGISWVALAEARRPTSTWGQVGGTGYHMAAQYTLVQEFQFFFIFLFVSLSNIVSEIKDGGSRSFPYS